MSPSELREADIEEFPAPERLQGKFPQEEFGELTVTSRDWVPLFR